MPVVSTFPPPQDIFDDDDDDDGWQDMPVVREDTSLSGLDEEDQKKYRYQLPSTSKTAVNATGNLIDVDDLGNEWRSKLDNKNESEYTRLRVNEEDEVDEVHLRTKYLFDEDKAMTPLSQMQATKNLLTEAQRIAYVGLCALTSREMVQSLKTVRRKELKASIQNMELWALKIMGRLYYHMELETQEQKMIESLAEHGVLASDLVPALMTTHTVANPEYDPEEARRKAESAVPDRSDSPDSTSDQTLVNEPLSAPPPSPPSPHPHPTLTQTRTTTKVLQDTSTASIPGVSTSLSTTDESVTLDIRWTVLCDLFLILIADSVYDARSRVLLEQVALKLGLGWLDVVKFESRVTQALEIQEDIETLEQGDIVEGARKAGNKRRYVMLGLATIGGGLVIGLSAGLLAPVIGLGLAGALTTVGVTGTGVFLGGAAGAAVITTGGVLTGSGIAVRGMVKRTQQVRTFDILPLHNHKRVNCILTVPGFMNGMNDDVRLPFSVLDPIVGDVFSVLWEPEMIRETGSALKILTGEVLSQIGMTVLQATVMTGLMSALQWPIILTKLGYLIDNPWSNALDRARAAGRVLADVLIHRHLGVRPITLIGFSLGARVIFYALLELSSQKAFGIVQDVFLLGATLTVSTKQWIETRSVVSGRYVNAFAKNDWVLNYLFRATSGGVGSVAGLGSVQGVPGLENVDVTDKIAGHMSYRTFMPLILDQLGFPVFSDYFDEPEEPEFDGDRVVIREEDNQKKGGWFSSSSSKKKASTGPQRPVQRPPSTATFAGVQRRGKEKELVATQQNGSGSVDVGKAAAAAEDDDDDDELPPRMATASPRPSGAVAVPSHATSSSSSAPASGSGRNTPAPAPASLSRSSSPAPGQPSSSSSSTPNANNANASIKDSSPSIPLHAGFDLTAIENAIKEVESTPIESGSESKGGGGAGSSGASTLTLTPKKSFLARLAPSTTTTTAPMRSYSTPPMQVVAAESGGRGHGHGHEKSSSLDGDVESESLATPVGGPAYPYPGGSAAAPFSRSFSTPLTSTSRLGDGDMTWASASTSTSGSLSNVDFSSTASSSYSNMTVNPRGLGKSSLSFGSPFGYGDDDDDDDEHAYGAQPQLTARPHPLTTTSHPLPLGLPSEDDITPSWGLGLGSSSSSSSLALASSATSAAAAAAAAAAATSSLSGPGRYSIPSPPRMVNPFSSSSNGSLAFGSSGATSSSLTFGSSFAETPALSFGGLDGGLEGANGNGLGLGLEAGKQKEDAWSIPPLGGFGGAGAGGGMKRKGSGVGGGGLDGAAGFGSNPWS